MKRFASHRVCFLNTGEVLSKQVVEIDETTGVVSSVFPFTGEIPFTEWLGGMIVVSDVEPDILPGESFVMFADRMRRRTERCDYGLAETRAYFITSFNLLQTDFMPDSRIVRLT